MSELEPEPEFQGERSEPQATARFLDRTFFVDVVGPAHSGRRTLVEAMGACRVAASCVPLEYRNSEGLEHIYRYRLLTLARPVDIFFFIRRYATDYACPTYTWPPLHPHHFSIILPDQHLDGIPNLIFSDPHSHRSVAEVRELARRWRWRWDGRSWEELLNGIVTAIKTRRAGRPRLDPRE